MRGECAALLVAFAAFPALAGCGDDDGEDADRFAQIPKRTIEAPPNTTAPRWEQIGAFSGSGRATKTVEVSRSAIQWRVRWRCRAGGFSVALTPAPQAGPRQTEGDCPGSGKAIWATAGTHRLQVEASERWRLIVEQELRTPLHEPPLPAMRSARRVASGSFYPIEIKGRGTASLYRLGPRKLALRIERFGTEPNPSLVVWLSEARRPRTTKEAFRAAHVEIAPLKSTLGDQNYILRRSLDPNKVRSVVIWNEPSRIAYAAATLSR